MSKAAQKVRQNYMEEDLGQDGAPGVLKVRRLN